MCRISGSWSFKDFDIDIVGVFIGENDGVCALDIIGPGDSSYETDELHDDMGD